MFSIFDTNSRHSRRSFLQIGSLGLGELTLADLLAAKAKAGTGDALSSKSVIFVFQHGGPSQFETWDPKMSAPEAIRTTTGEIQTSLPGVTFGSHFPRLARLADKLAIVRNYVPGDSTHDAKPIVHRDTLGANLGSIYARVAGLNNPVTGMPTNVLLYPQAISPKALPPILTLGNLQTVGPLSSAYTPFMPGASGDLQKDMRLSIPADRLADRRAMLQRFDRLRRELDRSGEMETTNRYRDQAFNVILRGAADAFDLNREPERVRTAYDTSRLVNPDRINKKWGSHPMYADHGRTVGNLLLLARRLCEAGCGFVTVCSNFVWDMHADASHPGVKEGMDYTGTPFDFAVSALINDIEARGLSDQVLVVACGEIGRTPKINKNGGRDHWANLAPLLFYGGGLKMGQVIGRSTSDGGEPNGEANTVRNLISTIMHYLFGDVTQVRLIPGISADVSGVITQGEPIVPLFK
jgi:hypothetical protein